MTADENLVRNFRAGEAEAFTAIYRAHHPAVFRFALHMTGDRNTAIEVTQDVFVWLIRHAAEFDAKRGELSSFLIGVARKLMKRRFHAARRFVPFSEAPVQVWPDSEQGDSDTAELRKAIQALPARYREAVVLCDLEEKTYEEAASALDCAIGTVRSRLHRARALLARKLGSRRGCEV